MTIGLNGKTYCLECFKEAVKKVSSAVRTGFQSLIETKGKRE
jgi:hypothetical protein